MQQPFVLGVHAENALNQEVGDLLAIQATPTHGHGDFGELAGGLSGDGSVGLERAQLVDVLGREQPAQGLQIF
ncbi:hypothetical protein [Stutzerimonas kunmingensis]|uniref:hypothetical protein n=1 Tax=Stutzerimonas kunmingensis TaxID=1211807 RepID=UPI002898006D|nr:hypothetical protein [Stutzerimonas kunmingensis]